MNVSLMRQIDKWVFGFLILILKVFPKRKSIGKNIENILVVKLWAVGDAVLSLPMIEGLKIRYPKAKIDVFCHKNNSFVYKGYSDSTYYFPGISLLFKISHYDLVIDTEPFLNVSAIYSWYLGKYRIGFGEQWRSSLYNSITKFDKSKHIVQNYLDMIRSIGIKYDTDRLTKINIDAKLITKTKKEIGKTNKIKIIGITPAISGSVQSRMWPLENMAQVIDYLLENGYKIIIMDSKEDAQKVDELLGKIKSENKKNILNYTGKADWQKTTALISACDIFISNDTGPLHIASAQGIKTIGLFGPNIPSLWGPYGKGNIALYHKVSCSPCIKNDKGIFPGCIYKGTKDYQMCMKKITPKEVINAINSGLKA